MTRKSLLFALSGVVACAFVLIGQNGAMAEKRVALVIGNSKYIHAAELKNPANDAVAMAQELSKLHFDVVKGVDLDENGMRSAINEFARAITDAQVALLFYAGHGLQVDGQNYLLPVNAELNNEIDLQFQGVSVDFLLRVMENRNRTSIVLLDACRNNPLAAHLARSMNSARGRSIAPGLARVESGVGTYIGFSTSPNSVALDGDGNNSPFTAALLKHIATTNEDIEAVMRNVREDVIKATNGTQVPWGNSSLVGNGFVFNSTADDKAAGDQLAQNDGKPTSQSQTDISVLLQNLAAESGQTRSAADKEVEITYWNSIKDSSDKRFFQAYLDEYPDGVFSGLARLKIAMLEGQGSAKAPEKPAGTEDAKPAGEKNVEVANLPKAETPAVAEAKPEVAEPTPELLKSLQAELNRVGCSAGGVDGVWGPHSQSALEDFVSRRGLKLASVEPSEDILGKLKAVDERVCPLVCGRGFVKKGDSCERVIVKRKTRRATAQNNTITLFPRTTARRGNAFNQIQNNRHMPPGVDSDGGQM